MSELGTKYGLHEFFEVFRDLRVGVEARFLCVLKLLLVDIAEFVPDDGRDQVVWLVERLD